MALLFQLPYLLWPTSGDAWTYVRLFGILYYPVCFSMLFLRFFRGEAFGQARQQGTFYQLVNTMRVERYKELLQESPNIDKYELMFRSGFNSPSTMYRVFKTFTGQTPKTWLKNKSDAPKQTGQITFS